MHTFSGSWEYLVRGFDLIDIMSIGSLFVIRKTSVFIMYWVEVGAAVGIYEQLVGCKPVGRVIRGVDLVDLGMCRL